jgi:integrase/recombinase XerD
VDARNLPVRADPRTTMRFDRARQNLDRHPNYILAAYVASGT